MSDVPENSQTMDSGKKAGKRSRVTNLPPCDVCGEKASGLHYGVNSCEACKAFFYRNSKKAQFLYCSADGECKPESGTGYTCPACRMKKCLACGMSEQSIKKGRYTYEIKAHLKKELAKNQDFPEECPGASVTSPSSKPRSPVSLVDPDLVKNVVVAPSPKKEHKEKYKEPRAKEYLPVRKTHHTNYNTESLSNTKMVKQPKYENTRTSDGCVADVPLDLSKPEKSYTNGGQDVECQNVRVMLTNEEIDAIVQSINEIYERHKIYTPEFYRNVKYAQQIYMETKREKKRIYGDMKPLPIDEFLEVYASTGIDVDGRLSTLRTLCPLFERSCVRYVKFAKELPSFKKLCKEDQLSMLKGAKTAFWFLHDFLLMDVENGMMTGENYETMDIEDLERFITTEYIRDMFQIALKLQSYNLSESETNILRAMVLTNPDLCITNEGKRSLTYEREILFEVLRYLVYKYHPEDPQLIKDLPILQETMQYLDREETTQWRFVFSLFRPIVKKIEPDYPAAPIVTVLYDLATNESSSQEIQK